MEQYYKITYLRKKYNISTRTLRWYEEKGLIQSVRIPEYSYRVYTASTVRQLEYILYFRKMGIGLQEISSILSRNTPEEINKQIQEKQFQIDDQIQQLVQQRNALVGNLTGFSETLNQEKEQYLATVRIDQAQALPLSDLVYTENGTIKNPSTRVFHQIHDRQLTLWDQERCLFTAQRFAPPFTLHVTAKTNHENLRLYFGPLELIFRWEQNPDIMVFYDHEHALILKIPVGELIPENQFVDIYWCISGHSITCCVGDTTCFSLDHPFSPCESYSLGFGTLPGNQITIQQASLSLSNQEPFVLDLTLLQHQSDITEINADGHLVLCHSGDTQAMLCDTPFSVPMEYTTVAKVSKENLRLYFHRGVLILNWEKQQLFWRDPLTGEERLFSGLGYIAPNQFHTIRQIFDHDTYLLEIDGIAQLLLHDAPYMKQTTPFAGKVGIGTAFSNTVTVKSLTVASLHKKTRTY
ncbi:MAG: MerR family transcriptional regulator [Clostridia bacterium]|nr:MerR family transcriptional regulator [Clostridia bacterium]